MHISHGRSHTLRHRCSSFDRQPNPPHSRQQLLQRPSQHGLPYITSQRITGAIFQILSKSFLLYRCLSNTTCVRRSKHKCTEVFVGTSDGMHMTGHKSESFFHLLRQSTSLVVYLCRYYCMRGARLEALLGVFTHLRHEIQIGKRIYAYPVQSHNPMRALHCLRERDIQPMCMY